MDAPICKNYDDYTQKLNGGLNQFKDQRYRIEICGAGPNDSGNHDPIRLRVFDTDGISYFDFSSEDPIKTLRMPPSLLDWLKARIPLLD
ncbi:hypothetical protein [uncultured Herbaspirillum sp.]|uniref:hypothetical protein n=1 Tax=uncultured Herbaspirillum sp. TaxID=160236 RepID=UPI002588248C|nr:hypothetical protein [uncultured Herbaspirillum sp.]